MSESEVQQRENTTEERTKPLLISNSSDNK